MVGISSSGRNWDCIDTSLGIREVTLGAFDAWDAKFLLMFWGCIRRGKPDAAELRKLADWIDANPRSR